MPSLNPARPQEVVKALEKAGFARIRQSGSHFVLKHPDGRGTTVAMHTGRDVGRGLLAKILKDAGLTPEEFERLR